MSMKAVGWLSSKLGVNIGGRQDNGEEPPMSDTPTGRSPVEVGTETTQSFADSGDADRVTADGGNGESTVGKYWKQVNSRVTQYLGSLGAGGEGGGSPRGMGNAFASLANDAPRPAQRDVGENTDIDENGLPVSKNWYFFNKEMNRWDVTPEAPESIKREHAQKLWEAEQARLAPKVVAPPPPPPPPGSSGAARGGAMGPGGAPPQSMFGTTGSRVAGPQYAVPDYFNSGPSQPPQQSQPQSQLPQQPQSLYPQHPLQQPLQQSHLAAPGYPAPHQFSPQSTPPATANLQPSYRSTSLQSDHGGINAPSTMPPGQGYYQRTPPQGAAALATRTPPSTSMAPNLFQGQAPVHASSSSLSGLQTFAPAEQQSHGNGLYSSAQMPPQQSQAPQSFHAYGTGADSAAYSGSGLNMRSSSQAARSPPVAPYGSTSTHSPSLQHSPSPLQAPPQPSYPQRSLSQQYPQPTASQTGPTPPPPPPERQQDAAHAPAAYHYAGSASQLQSRYAMPSSVLAPSTTGSAPNTYTQSPPAASFPNPPSATSQHLGAPPSQEPATFARAQGAADPFGSVAPPSAAPSYNTNPFATRTAAPSTTVPPPHGVPSQTQPAPHAYGTQQAQPLAAAAPVASPAPPANAGGARYQPPAPPTFKPFIPS